MMKLDMHCHTREGSLDAKVPIAEYIKALKEAGFGGMLVTDHDSYNGYRHYLEIKDDPELTDFVVLRGIEYDTKDAGHILVVMPEDVDLSLLELRGLPVQLLIDLVHQNGGILGPAHPCGERYVSIMNTKKKQSKGRIMEEFDFIEGFNACESAESNRGAMALARKYGLPTFGGSDSHKMCCVGHAYTELPDDIRSESALIGYVRDGGAMSCGGSLFHGTSKERMGPIHQVMLQSFYVYNAFSSACIRRRRNEELHKAELC